MVNSISNYQTWNYVAWQITIMTMPITSQSCWLFHSTQAHPLIVPTTKSTDYLDFLQSLPPSVVLPKFIEDVIVKTRHKKSLHFWVCPNISFGLSMQPWFICRSWTESNFLKYHEKIKPWKRCRHPLELYWPNIENIVITSLLVWNFI